MFTNIGKKIKLLAQILFWVFAVCSVAAGVVLIATDDDLIVIGIAVLLFGPLLAWTASCFLYGFGELVDKAADIEKNTRAAVDPASAEAQAVTERLKKLQRLRAQGLITAEEYEQAISK